ncbi:MAG: ribosome-associated translation inhibitor RaiA [Pirellulales bacterium]|nr:ribosome-associated translation inhibitor RaiA [Pirellulales bacterium]
MTARHGALSAATQEKVTAKFEKLSRLFDRLSAITVTVDLEHRDTPVVDVKVSAEHKHDFVARDQADELMAAVDAVIHKLEQQLRKHKEKVLDRHRGVAPRETPTPTGQEEVGS